MDMIVCDTTDLQERHEDEDGVGKLGEVFPHMDRRSLQKMKITWGITSLEQLLAGHKHCDNAAWVTFQSGLQSSRSGWVVIYQDFSLCISTAAGDRACKNDNRLDSYSSLGRIIGYKSVGTRGSE
jgi:hypothetical protein